VGQLLPAQPKLGDGGKDAYGAPMIAVCHTLEQVRDAIALYCEDKSIPRLTLDERTGLASGYSGKVLGRKGPRKLAAKSLQYMLAALDLELVIRERCAVSPQSDASADASKQQSRKAHFKDWRRNFGASWSRRMNGRRNLKLTPRQRSDIASKAAQARWARARAAAEQSGTLKDGALPRTKLNEQVEVSNAI
jgi:hypothetical protein